MILNQKKIKSPLGFLYLVASATALKGIFFEKPLFTKNNINSDKNDILEQTEKQLNEYFSGKRTHFDIPLDPDGTSFQKKVWKQLLKIPYGKTKSYKDVAHGIKDDNASRAVGTANGKNPICVIIPCHRVITSGGKLGGYSGGLDKKVKLLNIESVDTSQL